MRTDHEELLSKLEKKENHSNSLTNIFIMRFQDLVAVQKGLFSSQITLVARSD